MAIWPPQKKALTRPIYLSLASAMLQAMRAGELTGGDRLPTHRDLAYQLGISVQTASRAYEELIRIGAISGHVGRGSFVNGNISDSDLSHFYLPEEERSSLIDLSILKPVGDQIHIDYMRTALLGLVDTLPSQVVDSFRPTDSSHHSEETARIWLQFCGVELNQQSLLITNGNTTAMTVALMSATKPGDIVLTEAVGHHTLNSLVRFLGLRLKGLPTDSEGVKPEEFQSACANHTIKVLYLMPSGLGPHLSVMSISRRLALIDIAKKNDVFIIENDAWGPLQPDRPLSFAMLAPERTFYFTSMTKCLMPGLRVGYLIVPDSLSEATRNRHLVTNWMATSMMVEIASRWIEDGSAQTLVRWQIAAITRRNQIAQECLQGITFLSNPAGLHIWLPLRQINEIAFVNEARQLGVGVAPGEPFTIGEHPKKSAVRICLGGVSEHQLVQGLSIIRKIMQKQVED
mgnify:CR=1 FL=1|tara:strand:- start:795 stop:2171 length:1377 start_codon:yes stop_codon:yes gene_type:complete